MGTISFVDVTALVDQIFGGFTTLTWNIVGQAVVIAIAFVVMTIVLRKVKQAASK